MAACPSWEAMMLLYSLAVIGAGVILVTMMPFAEGLTRTVFPLSPEREAARQKAMEYRRRHYPRG